MNPSVRTRQRCNTEASQVAPFEDVYTRNNEGCRHLRNGDRQAAINCFKAVLTQIKSILQCHNGVSDAVHEDNLSSPQLLPMPAHVLRTNLPQGEWEAISDRRDSLYFTFSSAIPYIPSHRFFIDVIEEGNAVSALTIFNVAVTLHLMANDSGCPQDWKRAKSLYAYAQRVLGPIIHRHRRTPLRNAAFDLLTLALFNNTAVAHWECQEYDDAQEAFGQLAYLAASSTSLFLNCRCMSHQMKQVLTRPYCSR